MVVLAYGFVVYFGIRTDRGTTMTINRYFRPIPTVSSVVGRFRNFVRIFPIYINRSHVYYAYRGFYVVYIVAC